ncbi:MAG: glycosyltransferase [Acidobacteria bacterium]|nr:glycosyltransferase [Acidobacteriota bacterium]
MRILLAHNSLYYPSCGGGDKSNRLLLEALAGRGHMVRAVARVEDFSARAHQELLGQLAARGVAAVSPDGESIEASLNGVEQRILSGNARWRAYFAAQAAAFDPGIILTSTDDPALLLFEAAVRCPRARVVYLVRATIATPFGPDATLPNAARTAMLQAADGVVGVSEYVARYSREHGGLDAVHVPISLLAPGEWPALGSIDNRFVTLVNPCAMKGLAIFLALAERFPALEFAAVPSWGTTRADRDALERLPNVTILAPVSRGIPVMASAVGGLEEAMLGQDYLLPVTPVTRYRPAVDERMVPSGEIPPQDLRPWASALEGLTTDRAHYETLSAGSRRVALAYARELNAGPFEAYLESLLARPKRAPLPRQDDLAGERRRLLRLRLKKLSSAAGSDR